MQVFLKYIHTIRYLKPAQLFYRIYYPVRNRLKRILGIDFNYHGKVSAQALKFTPLIPVQASIKRNSFCFLNQSLEVSDTVNWDESCYGLLWTFNLNYFEYLQQEEQDKDLKLGLMKDFVSKWNKLTTARHPYTISLRGINWIKYLSQIAGAEPELESHLFGQYKLLNSNIEYDIQGNHLLENGFSLLFAAYFYKNNKFYRKAEMIIRDQLREQILSDGAHFELSPLYHRIVLMHLLDTINLVKNNAYEHGGDLQKFMEEQAEKMLAWMDHMTLSNKSVPDFNDSAASICPEPGDIKSYAERLGIKQKENLYPLESGYRIFRKASWELICDMGNIGPDHQPGHAHSDTFGFELYIDSKSVITDTGTSTYEPGEVRNYERSTKAHNTVEVNELDQSEVWAAFRVARRARVNDLQEKENFVSASHNGYKRIGLLHRRTFRVSENNIFIHDELQGGKEHEAHFYLHFSPGVEVRIEGQALRAVNFEIHFKGQISVELSNYMKATCFNQRDEAKLAVIVFKEELESEIKVLA